MELIVYGIVNSVSLALMAMGFTLVFGVSRLPNFAHGAFYVTAGFITWQLLKVLGLPYFLAALLALALVGVLGAAMYRLLTMKVPFEKKALLRSDLEAAFAVEPPTAVNMKVPVSLEVVVMKLLEVEADNRYQSCDELLMALDAVRDGLVR